ncbi:MAG: DNA-directed RNA polymerase subunit L [Crenarchaeota archaeon]|nr:DNA-directed RNA polymerase subunit L [Thermoproteota archaeon]
MLNIEIVRYDQNYLEIIVKGDTHTLFAPLLEYLLNHPDVEVAMYDVDHPLLQNVKFKLKTRTRDPVEVLKEVVQHILKDVDSIREQLLAQI